MNEKVAKASAAKELGQLAKDYAATITGGTAGHFGGKHVGKKLFDRKLRKLPVGKKAVHKMKMLLSKKYRTSVDLDRKIAGEAGAGVGQTLGGYAGLGVDMARFAKRFRKAADESWEQTWRNAGGGRQYTSPGRGTVKDNLSTLNIPKNVKTKKEAKKHFRATAFKHHPDRGGDPEKMKKVNEAWSEIKSSSWYEKLAHALLIKQAKKEAKPISIEKLKELLKKSPKSIDKKLLNKLFKRSSAKSFGLGLAAFGGGAALSRVASKASQKIQSDAEHGGVQG